MKVSNSIAELRQQIHEDLRAQHPEWIEATGECPKCNEHEARLREMLDALTRRGPNESVITTQHDTKTTEATDKNSP